MVNFCCLLTFTAQKMKFSIKDFYSKCDQIRSFLRIWSHLLKKLLMENLCIVSFSSCLKSLRLTTLDDLQNYIKIQKLLLFEHLEFNPFILSLASHLVVNFYVWFFRKLQISGETSNFAKNKLFHGHFLGIFSQYT